MMTVKLTINLGTRHPLVGVDPSKHTAGSIHTFAPKVEEGLIRLGHAEIVAEEPKPKRGRPRKTEPETPIEPTPTEES